MEKAMKATRKEAIEARERYFFTGKPCKHGHISKRITINGVCYECSNTRSKEHQAEMRKYLKTIDWKPRAEA